MASVVVGLLGLTLCWGFGASSASAQEAPQAVKAELIAEHASIQPGGNTRIGVSFDIEPGWHIYAQNPGDAGLPTTITWSAPSGTKFGPLRWPTPEQFIDPGEIRTFGYAGSVVLSSEMMISRRMLSGATVPVQAQVKWLACREICLPGFAQLALALPVSAVAPAVSTHAQFFELTDDSTD